VEDDVYRDSLTQAILSATGDGDYQILALEAARKWQEKTASGRHAGNSFSECGGSTYFHAVQRGFKGHMGEWMETVKEAAKRLGTTTKKTQRSAKSEPPTALDELDSWMRGGK
jgi:hypothetical protein